MTYLDDKSSLICTRKENYFKKYSSHYFIRLSLKQLQKLRPLLQQTTKMSPQPTFQFTDIFLVFQVQNYNGNNMKSVNMVGK